MKKLLGSVILLALLFSGCDQATNSEKVVHIQTRTDTVCLNGVKYYTWDAKYGTGISPVFNTESKVVKCYPKD